MYNDNEVLEYKKGPIVTIIILGILLVLSGFFLSTETAFSSINLIRVKQYSKSLKKDLPKRQKSFENTR